MLKDNFGLNLTVSPASRKAELSFRGFSTFEEIGRISGFLKVVFWGKIVSATSASQVAQMVKNLPAMLETWV